MKINLIKKLNYFILFLVLTIIYQINTKVNAQFTLDGEFRNKAMYLDGYKELRNSTKHPYGIIVQRSRLNLSYTNDNISYYMSFQDVRSWGQDDFGVSNPSINLFEAWVNFGFNDLWSIKFGRQKLQYDDGRLLSYVNWRDNAVVHDLAILKYQNSEKGFNADFGIAVNNPASYQNFITEYTLKNYKYMSYLWLNKKFFDKKLNISLMNIADVYQKPLNVNSFNTRVTTGPNISFKNSNFNIKGSYYYQGGKYADGKDINAYFYGVSLGYYITKSAEFTVGYDHYSGTDYKDTLKAKLETNTFDKLYGTAHTFLGYMDYFSGNNSDKTKGAGINDLFARFNYSFNEKHDIELAYHIFNLDKEYIPVANKESKKVDKNLGQEIDCVYNYKYNKNVNLQLGYCVMLPSETLENLHGYSKGESKFAQFAYLMITFKPTFFTTK